MRVIDHQEWIDTYKPEMEGESPMDIGFRDTRILTHPLHIWTMIPADDCDCGEEHEDDCSVMDEPDIFRGAAFVNRMEYYFCEVPFKINDDIGVA